MMQINSPETFQSTIVISNSRKDHMVAAMNNARTMMEKTTVRSGWEPYVETPAQKLANARDARIAQLISSL